MEPGQLRERELPQELDVMNILSHFVEPGGEQYGQGDEEWDRAMSFTPSQYKFQLLMSTDHRLGILDTARTQFPYPSELKVSPGILIFQQFLPKKKYNSTITITNTDTESHFVRTVPESNPVFTIEFKRPIFNTKIAPGMSHAYNIQFTPEEAKDYQHQLNLSSDLGLFSVRIIALGPRPLLDFPDIITLPPTAVKIPSATSLTVQNLGDAPAVFKLSSPNPQFSIKPSTGVLNAHQTLQFTLTFVSPSLGSFTGRIFLKYETGELIRIRTQGSTTNCKISLTTEALKMEETFLGLSRDKALQIFNNSDYSLDYQWMRYQTLQEDAEKKEKFSKIFTTLKDTETLRSTNLEYFDICDSEVHEKTCERILQDELSSLTTGTFLYSCKNFTLSPMSGRIGPRSSAQVLVTFEPQTIGEISTTAFLEISGSERRLPLNISGTCRGPAIKFNTSTIEIEKIYLCSTQNIEIICSNVGFIPGTLVHRERPSDFGAVIKVSPESHELHPNEYKSFNLSFMASRTGEFMERVDFVVDESAQIISVYVKGHSICPSLHFDKPSLDLGATGVSFTSTGEVTLENRSTVPVEYKLLVLDDVEKPVIFNPLRLSNTSSHGSTSSSTSHEFSISPDQGHLQPKSSTRITVEFSPTVARGRRQNNLKIQVEGSDRVQQDLPIFSESKAPVFEIEPSGVNIRSCFINFPYTISFRIKNESDVDGFCYFPRQSCSERSEMFYSLSRNQWHLKPKQSKSASITLITRSIGQHPMELCLLTRGGKSQKYFPIICEGQGPLVSVQPTHLDFGDVKVLETTSKGLTIINDSPIAADVKVFLKDKASPWRIASPPTEIPALKSIEIDVELMMRDPGTHGDKLVLQIVHGPPISVRLSAVGTGSSIIFDPPIFTDFQFGILLTNEDNTRRIMIKNEGTKVQKLFFSNNLELKNVKSPPTSENFLVEPFTLELDPGTTREIRILARAEAPGDVLEHWWIHALAEGQRRREILGECVISATFVVPIIKVNKKLLSFFQNVGPDEESCSEELIDSFEINNISGVMVHVKISLSGRFGILTEESIEQIMDIIIRDDDTRTINVYFTPEEVGNSFLSNVYDDRVRIEYDGSSTGISIKCRAFVNYPNLTFGSKELEFDAILGNDCPRHVSMRNGGPVPVHFNLSWVHTSVKMHWPLAPTSEESEANCGEESEESNPEEVEKWEENGEEIDLSMDDFCKLSITQGIIPPNSEEILVIDFSARTPMTLEAQLLCHVLGGQNDIIKIDARTDFVRYHLEPRVIDFGFQNVLTEADEVLFFDNSCDINLHFKVDCGENFDDARGILEITPSEGIITRRSKIELKVHYQCLIPGHFGQIFTVQIADSPTTTINIRGCVILPQIHLDLLHNWTEKECPVAKEYCALQSLDISTKIDKDSSVELIRSHDRLTEDDWRIIYPNDLFPTRLDIDMRIEQFLTTEFIKANRSVLLSTLNVHKPGPIPYLYSAEYVLDMGCLIVDQVLHRSLLIHNYSQQKISIRMKPPKTKNYLSRYGLMVKFRDQETLMPREFCKLDISINPSRDVSPESTQKIKRKIYLEVTNGCTVPISIRGIITSPILEVTPTVLNFGDVTIGNCKVKNFRIHNNGIVNCKWRLKIYSASGLTDFPFTLSDARGTYSPGESGVLSGYFKPRGGGNYQGEVIFEVNEGRPKSLILLGRGIEQKLRISEGSIVFAPVVPGASEKKELSVKNLSRRRLEFAWQHLDEVGLVEERIIRVLTHYYGSKELLLPVRELGSVLPEKIYEFYDELVEGMKAHAGTDGDSLPVAGITGGNDKSPTGESSQEDSLPEKQKKLRSLDSGVLKDEKPLRPEELMKDESPNNEVEETPEKIEELLHNYIDRLHEGLEFAEKMRDPVAAIFAESNLSSETSELEVEVNNRKVKSFIIFHGAPFTKYQDTACKAANILGIRLLNLNTEITEAIAMEASAASSKVKRIIDEKYQELLAKARKFIEDDLPSERDSSKNTHNLEEPEDYLKGNVDYTFLDPPDPLLTFRKIPGSEELELLDALTQYEYKIEALQALEKILENSGMATGKSRAKGDERAPKTIRPLENETLVGIEVDLFAEVLKDIVINKFDRGFVLQTLNNDFMRDHSTTFSKILDSLPPEFVTFINFHNSLEIYQQKARETRNQIAREQYDKLTLKLRTMDEMSMSEFEELSEEDKNLFIEGVQRPRIEEARERREKFQGKMSKSKTETESPNLAPEDTDSLPSQSSDRPRKSSKKPRGPAAVKVRKSKAGPKNDPKDEKILNEKRSSGRGRQWEESADQAVAEAMDLYNKNIETMKSVIGGGGNIWLAAFTDPWNPTNYDCIIDQIRQNNPPEKGKSMDTKTSSCQIEDKIYSLYTYNKTKRCLSALPDKQPFRIEDVPESKAGLVAPRTVLDPSEVKSFKAVFNPQKTGDFHHEFLLTIVGNDNHLYRISLSGICDIPRLNMDPKSIFARRKDTKVDEVHDPTFFVDTKTFDFGCLLTPEKNTKEERVHRKTSRFNFVNCSLINIDVQFSLEDGHSGTFILDKSSASVPPGEKEVLSVIATAPQLHANTDKLLITILHNPQVDDICLKSSGCKLNVEVDGKVVNFGRILLYRKDCSRVGVKNKTPVRLFWRIMESSEKSKLNPQISFSSSSGVIEPLKDSHFYIHFHGEAVGIVNKESVPLGLFLFESDEEALVTENVSISAEVYDVSVDVNNASPIDLKTLKIGENTSEAFSLKNQGQYDIKFVMELEKLRNLSGLDQKIFKSLKEHLTINPLAGTLVRDKVTSISVGFTPKMEMRLKDIPILKCNLFDTSKDAALIAEIPLTISIVAQYSRIIIEPYPELFCGSLAICTHKTTSFTIRNPGLFPVEYKISSEALATTEGEFTEILPPKIPKEVNKKKGRGSTIDMASKSSAKPPSLKFDEDPLKIGPFTLINREGAIAVGEFAEISVDCYPEVQGSLRTRVYIEYSNSPPEDQDGRQFTLNLDSCIPTVAFDDITSIFCDSYIADLTGDFPCTFDDAHSVVSEEEKTLYFEKVLVSNRHNVQMELYNPGLVPAEVAMSLRASSADEEAEAFGLDPRGAIIPPMTGRVFEVSFTPTCMAIHSCTLEAAVVLPDHLDPQKLSVNLIGEGCLPEITFIQPKNLCKYENGCLDFGKSLLGEAPTEIIAFQNTGKIRARVVAEIVDDVDSLYHLTISDPVGEHHERQNFLEIMSKSGDTSEISVVFEAREIGIFQALLRIFVSENPYDVTNIDLRAEGFVEPVVIRGLPLMRGFPSTEIVERDKSQISSKKSVKTKKKKDSITKKRKKSSPVEGMTAEDRPKAGALAYELHLGACSLGEERGLEFEIVNTCDDKCFRFEVNNHESFHFVPSIGHLGCLEKKKIRVKFCSEEPVTYEELCLNCSVDEIQLLENSEECVISWDDQQRGIVVLELAESNLEEDIHDEENHLGPREIDCPVQEPHYELIKKDSQIIQLVTSARADWAIYFCAVTKIDLEDTFVLERSTFTFEVANLWAVDLIYSWKIIDRNHHSMKSLEDSTDLEASLNSLSSNDELNYESKTHNSRVDLSVEDNLTITSRCWKILPETGTILPTKIMEFRLTFSPEEERQYNAELICEIAHLDPQMPPLIIPISGKGRLPHYHFEVPECEDDHSKLTENIENLPGNIKILEFRVTGVGDHLTKRFNLINPTDESYEFTWREKTLGISQNVHEFPYFQCESVRGVAEMRGTTEVSFSFFARDVGSFKSLWEFSIDQYEIRVPFLLVGVVTDPQVTCCPQRVELRPTVPGKVVEESFVLTNHAENSVNFSVNRNSLLSHDGLQRLFLSAMTGILMPSEEEVVTVKFKPTIAGNFNFSLEIEVQKMREPLKVSIASRVCEVIPRLVYRDPHNEPVEVRPDQGNPVDLGKLMIKKPTIVHFELSNLGELPFRYEWNVDTASTAIGKNLYDLKIENTGGEVESSQTITSRLTLMALKRLELKNHSLKVKITNGPMFSILLNASAKSPSVEFSFTRHNFGACYIRDEPYEVILEISNNEETPAILEVQAEDLQKFKVNSCSLSQAVLPRNPVSVPIYFQPVEEQKYEEHVTFRINSTTDKRITLRGEGISHKVNLLNPHDKLIDLGHVPLGKATKRVLSIINPGKTRVKLEVSFMKPPRETINQSSSSSITNAIRIQPTGSFTLPPNKPHEMTIKFKPGRRMNSFEEIIGAHIGPTFLPLAILRGRCLAPEFHLNRSIIQFDTITEGFTEEEKIVLHNSGDFPSKYKWKLPHFFAVKPTEGTSSPGSDITFNIKFTPSGKMRRFEEEGAIELESYTKIGVTFIGSSKPLPEPLDVINFNTPVRQEEQKHLDLVNNLNVPEKIEIRTFGKYFTADKLLTIPPKSSKSIVIKYLPLIMTPESNYHEGKVIVRSLEQKEVKIYELKGSSSPPESLGTLVREVPAKKKHTELFSVENWSDKPQHFKTNIELMSSSGNEVFTFTGNDKIDVNARGRRSYQAVFHCFNESTLNFRVLFTNSEGEYQFYEVEYKVTRPEVIRSIEMLTTARTLKNYSLAIVNPLGDKPVNYSSVKCDNSLDLVIEGIPKTLSPRSVDKIVIQYLPMFPGESRELFEVISEELGVFPYELQLKSLPPAPEKVTSVSTTLGMSKKFYISVKNSSRATAEFVIRVEEPLTCEENRISVDSGEEKPVEVTYEPWSIGRIERNVTAASTTAGEIVYPVLGKASLPKAQGPFALSTKKQLILPFKNVFNKVKTFQYVVEPTNSFSTASPASVIESRQTVNIVVSFRASSGDEDDEQVSSPITGKLVVYCADPEVCHVNWIYYLKGVAPE